MLRQSTLPVLLLLDLMQPMQFDSSPLCLGKCSAPGNLLPKAVQHHPLHGLGNTQNLLAMHLKNRGGNGKHLNK
jgi:hypothetical protein